MSFLTSKIFNPLYGFEMQLHPKSLFIFVDPSKSMRWISIHMSKPIGSTSVTHKNWNLMSTLWRKTPKIPSTYSALKIRFWIFFLAVNKIREFDGISNEKNWSIISSHIPVAFFSVKFNSKTLIKRIIPLGSLSVSCDPFSPATVENLAKIGVFFPML